MRSYFLHVVQKIIVYISASLLVLLPFFPTPTQALSSKTYSFTPTHAKNYVTTGNVDFANTPVENDWYSPDWKYRQKITINKNFIAGEVSDFPIVIRLDEHALLGAQDDHQDLLFTSADGLMKLAHEREDNTTMWVKVPKLTPEEDTVLYLYYGNLAAEDQQRPEEVWTSERTEVWHLNDNPGGEIRDATDSSNTGTSQGGMNRDGNAAAGKIGGALSFDGTDDYISRSNFARGQTNLTVSAWVKPARLDAGYYNTVFWESVNESGVHVRLVMWVYNSGTIEFGGRVNDTGAFQFKDSVSTIPLNTWSHVVGVWNGSNGDISIYVNGNQVSTTGTGVAGQFSTINAVTAGIGSDFQGDYMNGSIDEFRVYNHVATPGQIATEYANQCDCEEFLTISDGVESSDTTLATGTVTLKKDRPLSFSSLTSFIVNAGGDSPKFQLSNDAGKTWLFYTSKGWKGANPKNSAQSSSARDISAHLKTFPTGEGKLLWKAYLAIGTTLEQIQVTYSSRTGTITAGLPTSLTDPRIVAINDLFTATFGRPPRYHEWLYWANRLINGEKSTTEELLGAMQWAALQR